MSKTCSAVIALLIMLTTACAPLATRETEAPRIEGTPGKAVVYLVRANPGLSDVAATVTLNDQILGTTYSGTYFRLELPAGRHRLSGFASDSGSITLDVQADRVYFVEQSVAGYLRSESSHASSFSLIDERRARAALARAQRIG